MPEIVVTNTFKRGYKLLSSEYKLRVDAAIRTIEQVEDPRILGIRKKGKLAELFSYEIGQHVRILYSVNNDTVLLLRVGSHTQVYS